MLWILVTVVVGLGQWAIYTALLWGMIKVQRLNYNFLGLIGSSALATALGYIPVVGCYIGWAALVICLWKVTRADIAPDILFTVGVAGALMFCVNLFAIGWLMGNLVLLSPALAELADDEDDIELSGNFGEEWMEPDELNAATVAPAAVPTNNVPSRSPKPTRVATGPAPKDLVIKGISLSAARKSALIGNGKDLHDVAQGEVFTIQSEKGLTTFVCEEVTASSVTLTANGAPMTLKLR